MIVSVDDFTVGGTPDDSKTFTLTITDVNEAPSISVAPVITSLPESTSTTTPLELATITVADDALGSNVLSLSGADAGAFEIVRASLRLKAGVLLDHESKAIFNVTVNVDDNSVGGTPDSSVNYVLSITDSDEWVIIEPNQRSAPAYGASETTTMFKLWCHSPKRWPLLSRQLSMLFRPTLMRDSQTRHSSCLS